MSGETKDDKGSYIMTLVAKPQLRGDSAYQEGGRASPRIARGSQRETGDVPGLGG
jgi:hypothetical protein